MAKAYKVLTDLNEVDLVKVLDVLVEMRQLQEVLAHAIFGDGFGLGPRTTNGQLGTIRTRLENVDRLFDDLGIVVEVRR